MNKLRAKRVDSNKLISIIEIFKYVGHFNTHMSVRRPAKLQSRKATSAGPSRKEIFWNLALKRGADEFFAVAHNTTFPVVRGDLPPVIALPRTPGRSAKARKDYVKYVISSRNANRSIWKSGAPEIAKERNKVAKQLKRARRERQQADKTIRRLRGEKTKWD